MQQNFNLSLVKELSQNDARVYLTKYIVPLTTGDYAFFEDGEYKIVESLVINRVYLCRIPKDLKIWFSTVNDKIYKVVYQLNKPVFFDNKINLCHPLPIPKPYKDFSDETKGNVNLFISYLKEILCDSRDDILTHLLKYLSNMFKGNKNRACIVLKTLAEGVGKSTLPQFIMKHILNKKLCLEVGSAPLKSTFNSILGGKLFVSFEELETFSTNEWLAVSTTLKRNITSEFITLEAKGTDRWEAENINNYFMLSNHEILDEGRRFFVLDIDTRRLGDDKYWVNLYDRCFTDEVGYAFYNYCIEIDTTGYDAQKYPETKQKLNSISKRLDGVYQFLKEEYILRRKAIYHTVEELYNEYITHITLKQKKPVCKSDFNSKLAEIQIKYYKSSKFNKYKVSQEDLFNMAKNKHWLNELDVFINDDNELTITNDKDLDIVDDNLIKELKTENEQLKQQLEDMKAQLMKKNKKKLKKTIEDLKDLELELEFELNQK